MTDTFYIIGASQGFLLSIFLLLKKDKAILLPLIIVVFLISFELLIEYLYATNYIMEVPHLVSVADPFNALCGTLIFLYFRNIYEGKATYRRSDIAYFIPFLLYFIYYIPCFLQSAAQKIVYLEEYKNGENTSLDSLLEWSFEIAVTLPFLIASYFLLKKYELKVKEEYSNTTKVSYAFALASLIGFILLYLFEIIAVALMFTGWNWANLANTIIYGLATCITYLIGYEALVHQNNEKRSWDYMQAAEIVESEQTQQNENIKYKKNNLSEEKIEQIALKIVRSMENDLLYRNAELRLSHLAEKIAESPNHISQVINDVFKQNFYDFVNAYRIEEAKRLLKSAQFQNYSIVAIGEEVGFNSKSTFYTAFKKNTNLTPIQYQNSSNL